MCYAAGKETGMDYFGSLCFLIPGLMAFIGSLIYIGSWLVTRDWSPKPPKPPRESPDEPRHYTDNDGVKHYY